MAQTISTRELKHRLDQAPVALFDVRGDVEYEKAHIPGAKTAPLGSLIFRVADVMNPDSFVVVYSNSTDCDLAQQAVERLEGLGLTNVQIYKPGLKGWQEEGFEAVQSVDAKTMAWGPVIECRPLVVDRKRAYGGVFASKNLSVEGAGG